MAKGIKLFVLKSSLMAKAAEVHIFLNVRFARFFMKPSATRRRNASSAFISATDHGELC